MKRESAFMGLLLISLTLCGQTSQKSEPTIIKGQINDFPDRQIAIFFRGENEVLLMDTVRLDSTGCFYLKTYKVQKPQQIDFGNNKIKIRGLFIAPGYNLKLTGNGKDHQSLYKSKKVSGIGAQSNRYRFTLDSILITRKDTTWYELKEADLLTYIERDQKLKDSIWYTIFGKPSVRDNYLKHFGSVVKIENKFNKLYRLLVYVYWNSYTAEQATTFIRKHFDNKLLDDPYKNEYFISDYYKQVIGSVWLDYIAELDFEKDSSLRKQLSYKLKKVSESFKGKIKEHVLYTRMEYDIEFSKSLKQVNDYREQFEPYIISLQNANYKKLLEEKFEQKEKELLGMQFGKPAPFFRLNSNHGITYSLEDFKGKVVYLDFWASWCIPCREETPKFKNLYEKYKSDGRIAFISIGVHDEINNWKKAIEEDEPKWLQLIDRDEGVWKYYGANLIPRFVVIDKQGNIVNFDAPPPSSGKILEDLLNKEIEK